MDKKYETRGGEHVDRLPVKIYSVEGNENDYIHGAILEHGKWRSVLWNQDGSFMGFGGSFARGGINGYDLVEVKERKKIEGWVNVYRNETIGTLWSTKGRAADAREEAIRRKNSGGSGGPALISPGSIFPCWIVPADRQDFFACVKITIDCEEGEGIERKNLE